MKTYILKIRFEGSKIPYYMIEIIENQTLIDIHNAIQKALKWDNDHLYSFFFKPKEKDMQELRKALISKYGFIGYMSNETDNKDLKGLLEKKIENDLKHAKVEYSHPYELEEWQKSAKIKISNLGLELKDKFQYLFDYGDIHKFDIKVVKEGNKQNNIGYPKLIEKKGKTPQQYSRY